MPQTLNDNHFSILGVTRLSTKKEIKKAYYILMHQWHPDKIGNDREKYLKATEHAKQLNEAFELLKDYEPPELKTPEYNKNFKAAAQSKPKSYQTNIQRIFVQSSNLFSVGYDKDLLILQIEFRDKSVYEYYKVPQEIFISLMKAESKGKYANQNIFSNYKYQRVY